MDVLTVRDLSVVFDASEGRVVATKDISFRVPEGRTVALVGESGSGKTVVSQAILGILPERGRIEKGEIIFRDPAKDGAETRISDLKRNARAMRALRGGRISIIFQEPMTSLSPLHTIGDQVGEAYRLHVGGGPAKTRARTMEMLDMVGFPNPERALSTYPFELSGGLRQRAMIAMALICRPALLIADEPTTALDVTIQAQILKLIADLQAELKMAMLLITHDLGVVANVADEVVVAYHGEVMERGPKEAIFTAPKHPYLKALLAAVPRFDMKPGERLTPIRPIEPHAEGFLAKKGERKTAPEGAPLLVAENLSKRFTIRKGAFAGGAEFRVVKALSDVSFEVRKGECLGVVGESGCGKTTTAKIVMRALNPTEGRVLYDMGDGLRDVREYAPRELEAYRRRVQFMFQDPFSSLNPRMTVFEIIAEPLNIHGIGDRKERFERVNELMRLVGLDPRWLRRYPHSFSGGQRQRIGIARALALKPDLILCDEPVSALDVSVQAQVLNLLKDLKSELGLTYVFISHNLAVIDYIADRIAVMCRGHVVELAPRAQLFANPAHPYTKALLAAVPDPDPEARLDFDALMAGRASDPEAWPQPFAIHEDTEPRFLEVDPGHFALCGTRYAIGADLRAKAPEAAAS